MNSLILKGLITGILLMISETCLSQDNLNEQELIEFDYNTYSFNKTFPFDEIFSIKLVNIPPKVNNVFVRLYEYDLGNLKFKKGQTVTATDIKKSIILYVTEDWDRPTDSETKTAEIPVPYQLKPNHKYIVEVKSSEKIKLDNSKKTNLTATLKQDNEIKNIINEVTKNYINNPELGYKDLNITQARFNEIANRVVLKVNKDYRVYPIDPVSHLNELLNFINSLSDVTIALDNIPKNIDIERKDINKNKIISEIDEFKKILKKINWGNITSTDPGFKDLTEKKDNLFSQLSIDSFNSMKNIKDDIETFIDNILVQRDEWINTIAENTISENTYILSTINETYRTDFLKNAKLYVTLDIGAAYVGNIDRVLSYSGANIYFRPVNKNVPLRNYTGWDWLSVRTSFLVGVTMNSIEKTNMRKGLIGNTALVLGAGLRPVPFLKINGGCLVYYKYSNNPLISQERYNTTLSPFLSLSIDVDAKALFGGIGEAIFK